MEQHGGKQAETLWVLTPASRWTPTALAQEGSVSEGDLLADLRGFPSAAYRMQSDGTLQNVTADLIGAPNYWTVAREWLVRFTAQTGLQGLLSVDGYGFWWTLNAQKFVPALSELGNCFAWVDLLTAIRKQAQPGRLVIDGQHEAVLHLTNQIFTGLEIEIRAETADGSRGRAPPERQFGLLLARMLIGVAYFVYALFRHPDICFFSSTNLVRRAGEGGREELRDIYLDDVARALKGRGWRTVFVEKYGPNASWRTLGARGFFFPNDIVFLLSAPGWAKIGIHRQVVRRWHQLWASLRPTVVQHLTYRRVDIAPLVLPLVAREFTHNAPAIEVMDGIWRHILRTWRPKLLFVNNSYGPSSLPAIIAAKLLGIPTVEQQHGVLNRVHHPYLVPRELPTESRFPLCDTLIAWGDATKRLLVEAGAYQSHQVAVCGVPRTDALIGELPARDTTLAQIGVPAECQVVLYASNLVAQDLYSDILDSIDRAREPSGIYWIVKLHPREKTRRVWEAAIDRRGLTTVCVVEGEVDFYALLAACDLHVSFTSTTLIEAAILGKLNLGLAIPNVPDPVGYADAKAFLPVAPRQLGPAVNEILHDPGRREALLREQKAFAEDWCLHDGQALRRIVDRVESIIGQSGIRVEGEYGKV